MSLTFAAGPLLTFDAAISGGITATGELRLDLGSSTFELEMMDANGRLFFRLNGTVLETSPPPSATVREGHLVIGRRRIVFRVDTNTLVATVITQYPNLTLALTNGQVG